MDQPRIEQIYNEMEEINVNLAEDPRNQGSLYITSKIAEVTNARDKLNALSKDVERAFRAQRSASRLKKLMLTRMTEIEILALSGVEGISFQEKQVRAKHAAIKKIREQTFEDLKQSNQLPEGTTEAEHLPTIEDEIAESENVEEELQALRKVVEEKQKHLSELDSGVRLQERAIDSEMKNLQPNVMRSRVVRKPDVQRPQSDVSFSQLTEDSPSQIESVDKTVVSRED